MVEKDYVYKMVADLKKSAVAALNKNRYEDTLSLISICADLLYITNIYYTDNELEKLLETMSGEMISKTDQYEASDICVFWDGFGLNGRGLAQIYLKALCKYKKVIYVTYKDRENQIPDLKAIILGSGNICKFIDRKKNPYSNQIIQLSRIIEAYKPNTFFFYSTPNDIVATSVMYAHEGLMKRVQINLTDHAFWLGAGCIDECIEFREYGASISEHYRAIEKEKIKIIPFYPMIHDDRQFEGFPFEVKPNQKVVFSGGALYKTFSKDNKYYRVVERILIENPNSIFWYAGSGDDSEMKKLIEKFPGRACLTSERGDLFQVLENVDCYLSTYPISGGLMYQFAAMAGKVPLTLKSVECSDGFLINQKNLNVDFDDERSLLSEVGRLLNDNSYFCERKMEMKKAVIKPEEFDSQVASIFDFKKMEIEYPDIDTSEFQQIYLDNLKRRDIDRLLIRRDSVQIGLKYYPLRFVRGGLTAVIGKLLKK